MTGLHLAIEKNNIDIIKLLLERKDIDVNIKCVFIFIILI